MLGFDIEKLRELNITSRVEDISDFYFIPHEFIDSKRGILITKYASEQELELMGHIAAIYEKFIDELDPRGEESIKNFNKQVKGIFNLRQHSECFNVLLYPWIVILQNWYKLFGTKHINNDQPLLYWVDVPQSDRAGNIERLSYSDLFTFICYLGYYNLIDDDRIKEIFHMVESDIFSTLMNPMTNKAIQCQSDGQSDTPVTFTKDNEISIYSVPNFDEIESVFNRFCNYNDDEVLKFSISNSFNITNLLNIELIDPSWRDGCNCVIANDIIRYYKLYHQLFEKLVSKDLYIRNLRVVLNDLLKIDGLYQGHIMTSPILKIGYCLLRLAEGSNLDVDNETIRNMRMKLKNIIFGRDKSNINQCKTDLNSMLFFADIFQLFETKYGQLVPFDKKFLTENLICESVDSEYDDTIVEVASLMNALTEMFEVRRDGTIKVTLKQDVSYMSEYAENHRLLKYNSDIGDYEGMKYNLVYHMILIENIEKDVIFNKDIDKNSELYKDAEKARQFAKNDISIYLPEIRSHDKSFDLNTFYKKVKADRVTISIDGPATASGIKKILKSILLS